jgi:lipopolysaccharide/colanic/teichoic acid biosynthesis glycosyltransferase
MISLERKRSERSRKPFLLMLLDAGHRQSPDQRKEVFSHVVSALSESTRETDVTGWYEKGSVVGVMFTEIIGEDRSFIVSVVMSRVTTALRTRLTFEESRQISISFHLFPEDWGQESRQRPELETLYPDLAERDQARKFVSVIKRVMDVVGSVGALVAFSPLFLAIAAAVKLSSLGPVFFRQKRIGRHGVPFVFLKFRSMRVGSDSGIHKDYVVKLIAGQAERKSSNGNGAGVYKLTNDPRITRVGRFLRRTSLDELPQFFNVLKGEMSLVGPRPAIPYEVEAYDIWHRNRVLEAKPGITGLWQINGRSRVKFDEMVRLDLRYAKTWSLWMDIKILLRTPGAMFGEGAY